MGEGYYCDNSFSGDIVGAVTHTEELSYDRYEEDYIDLDLTFPKYSGAYGTNACCPTAGTMLSAYYDVTYDDIIPNFTPGFYRNGKFVFRGQNTVISSTMEEMYNLMGTNTIQPGTSEAQFKSGLTKYFNNHGYNLSYNKLSSPLNLELVKSSISAQKPIILFLSKYDYFPLIGVTINDNEFSMVGYKKTVGHVAMAYGYHEFRFYRNNSLFRTDKYLLVSFGDGTIGYLTTNSSSIFDVSYTVNVSPKA